MIIITTDGQWIVLPKLTLEEILVKELPGFIRIKDGDIKRLINVSLSIKEIRED